MIYKNTNCNKREADVYGNLTFHLCTHSIVLIAGLPDPTFEDWSMNWTNDAPMNSCIEVFGCSRVTV